MKRTREAMEAMQARACAAPSIAPTPGTYASTLRAESWTIQSRPLWGPRCVSIASDYFPVCDAEVVETALSHTERSLAATTHEEEEVPLDTIVGKFVIALFIAAKCLRDGTVIIDFADVRFALQSGASAALPHDVRGLRQCEADMLRQLEWLLWPPTAVACIRDLGERTRTPRYVQDLAERRWKAIRFSPELFGFDVRMLAASTLLLVAGGRDVDIASLEALASMSGTRSSNLVALCDTMNRVTPTT